MKAIWKDIVLAESDDTTLVDGRHYFPRPSVRLEYLEKSKNIYHCPWKGYADYYNIVVDGEVQHDAAWVYEHPYPEAQAVKGKFGFWKEVVIHE